MLANLRRRKPRKEAKKKGRTPSQAHLAMCDWTLFATNATADILPVEIILSLYRLRWQIELIFKQLKSVLRIHSSLNEYMWSTKGQEVSFDKLYKRIQERAFFFLRHMLSCLSVAITAFIREINALAAVCIKNRQPSRKTTLELLEFYHAAATR